MNIAEQTERINRVMRKNNTSMRLRTDHAEFLRRFGKGSITNGVEQMILSFLGHQSEEDSRYFSTEVAKRAMDSVYADILGEDFKDLSDPKVREELEKKQFIEESKRIRKEIKERQESYE